MLPRFEYSVRVPVSVDAAFHAFQNFNRLLHRGIYEDASWIEGEPWAVGSRARYVTIKPIAATISAVVSSCSPPHAVALLNHALGIIGEQHVAFGPDLRGSTRVRMTLDPIGQPTDVSESAIQEAIAFLVKDALDTMATLCHQRSNSSAPAQ